MARSTFQDRITRYTFSATGAMWDNLPPVQFAAEKAPFELREYFTLEEAKGLRDELDSVIAEVEKRLSENAEVTA